MSEAMRVEAGLAADIVEGIARVVPLPLDAAGLRREAIVLRDADGELRAYVNRCQHLPIPLDSGSRSFFGPDGRFLVCKTHGATYRLDDGMRVEGPCTGRALIALRLELEGEHLRIVLDDVRG